MGRAPTSRGPGAARRRLLPAALALAAAAACAAVALGRPGDLDTSFGTGGRVAIDLQGADSGQALYIQPDGDLVVAGGGGSNREEAVLRGLADGSPDSAFDGGTPVLADFGGNDVAHGAARTPDGGIAVVGTSLQGTTAFITVLRRTASGATETGFGAGNGRALLSLGGNEDGRAVAVQADGKIVVVGRSGAGKDISVTRLLPSGTPDGTFDGDGTATVNLGGDDTGWATLVQPDGDIVVAGGTSVGADAAVVRLTPTGGLDTSFNGTGKLILAGPGFGRARALARQPDGKILVAADVNGEMEVIRLTPGGRPDPGFAGAGTVLVPFRGNDTAASLALQPDGKILLAGSTAVGTADVVVARIQPGGTLDSTFGTGGLKTLDFGGTDTAGAIALRADGDILLAGTGGASPDIVLARLQGDPAAAAGGPAGGGPAGGGPGGAGGTPSSSAAPRCAGHAATIVGTRRADVLRGTARADVIAGLGGADVIRGLGGDDVICGGPGADTLLGGAGRDRLLGQAGRDLLEGGAGRDILGGGAGRDRCTGGAGRDRAVCERALGL